MKKLVLVALALAVLPLLAKADEDTSGRHKADDTLGNGFDSVILRNSTSLFKEGRHIFRYDRNTRLTGPEKADLLEYLKSL